MSDEYRALIADLEAEHADLDRWSRLYPRRSGPRRRPPKAGPYRDSILHLALTDKVAALAAADPAAFDAYRERRRDGGAASESQRSLPGDQVLDLWRTNRARLLEALGSVDSRARITWFVRQ